MPFDVTTTESAAAACRHCDERRVSRPRGLCARCFNTPSVRELYPSTSKYARTGLGLVAARGLPPMPTAAQPGSPEKVAVLAERMRDGVLLWHPDDAGDD